MRGPCARVWARGPRVCGLEGRVCVQTEQRAGGGVGRGGRGPYGTTDAARHAAEWNNETAPNAGIDGFARPHAAPRRNRVSYNDRKHERKNPPAGGAPADGAPDGRRVHAYVDGFRPRPRPPRPGRRDLGGRREVSLTRSLYHWRPAARSAFGYVVLRSAVSSLGYTGATGTLRLGPASTGSPPCDRDLGRAQTLESTCRVAYTAPRHSETHRRSVHICQFVYFVRFSPAPARQVVAGCRV